MLSDATSTIFLGKYVAAENKVYVEDPDHPGTFLPGSPPGAGQPIQTKYVILDVPKMRVFSPPDGSSAVVDIVWNLTFKPPTFLNDYVQSIDIAYKSQPAARSSAPQQGIIERTGFFRVGALSVGNRTLLPLVRR
jgi:hypothetical protein